MHYRRRGHLHSHIFSSAHETNLFFFIRLLRPKSYNPSSSVAYHSLPGSPPPGHRVPHQHSQNTIRLTTMQLSNMPFQSSPPPISSDRHHGKFESILEGVPASAPPISRGPSRERITSSLFPSDTCQSFYSFLSYHPHVSSCQFQRSNRVKILSSAKTSFLLISCPRMNLSLHPHYYHQQALALVLTGKEI